jgi:Na+/phosphate symporter
MKKLSCTSSTKEVNSTVEMLDQLFFEIYVAFMKHRLTLRYQQISDELSRQIRKSLARLYEGSAKLTAEEALAMQSTAINFSKVFYDLLRISAQVESKVKDNVMYSEVASKEMSDLMKGTRELLHHVGDVVLTRNELIAGHVVSETAALSALAASMSGMHEDRLCRGVCHPKASITYMNLLQHLTDILWHYKALSSEEDMVASDN